MSVYCDNPTFTRSTVESLVKCCLTSPLGFDSADIGGTLWYYRGCSCYPEPCSGYCDRWAFSIATLTDGRFIIHHDDADSSGHGRWCGAIVSVHPTHMDAWWHGLTQDERAMAEAHKP